MTREHKRANPEFTLELTDEQRKILSEKLGRKVTGLGFIEPEGDLAVGINGVAGQGLIVLCW